MKNFEPTLIILSIIIIGLGLLIYYEEKEDYKKMVKKCNEEQKEIVEYYRYDGEKDYTCR